MKYIFERPFLGRRREFKIQGEQPLFLRARRQILHAAARRVRPDLPRARFRFGGRGTGGEVPASLENFLQRVRPEDAVPVNLMVFQRITDGVDRLAVSLWNGK